MAVDVERTQLEGAPFLVFEGNGMEQRGLEGRRNGPNPFIERIGQNVDEGSRQELCDVVLEVNSFRVHRIHVESHLHSDLSIRRRSRS